MMYMTLASGALPNLSSPLGVVLGAVTFVGAVVYVRELWADRFSKLIQFGVGPVLVLLLVFGGIFAWKPDETWNNVACGGVILLGVVVAFAVGRQGLRAYRERHRSNAILMQFRQAVISIDRHLQADKLRRSSGPRT